ncbi:hypothetical protein AusDCA_3319 [Desulfitobacterium sp. AusDCA]
MLIILLLCIIALVCLGLCIISFNKYTKTKKIEYFIFFLILIGLVLGLIQTLIKLKI